MRRLLRRIYVLPLFVTTGRPLFAMARVRALEPVSLGLARLYAAMVHASFGRRRKANVSELADEWNRLMPSPREAFPVVSVEDDTAFVEIRIDCPLRGSGDAEACWRAMEFDRTLVRKSGGALVVLASQSVGGSRCRLAIRREGARFEDLEVAHPRWRG
ncbi:MAG: hypothetical protein AAGH15_06830 [Myxococcota bacterium]